MKKILVFVLALTLVLGASSFAFGEIDIPTDVEGDDRQEAISTLMALGIVNGYPDDTFKPDKTLKRGEMAKLLVTALGYSKLADGGYSEFTDTEGHWAESYISVAAGINLVLGYPDGTFRPEETLTMEESMTMIIRALGYTDDVLNGDWPDNYKAKAEDLKLTDNINKLSGDAPRGEVAVMLYNGLGNRMIEIIPSSSEDITPNYNFVKNNEGDYILLIDKVGKKVENKFIDLEDIQGEDNLNSVFDLEEYLFHRISYYKNPQEDMVYLSKVETEEVQGTLTDKTYTSLTLKDREGKSMTFVDIDKETPILYNGAKARTTGINDLSDRGKTEVKVIYNKDKEVQGIIAWEFKVEKITAEYTMRAPLKINGLTGFNLPKNDEGELDLDALTIEGDAEILEDIKKGDILYYYASDDTEKVRLFLISDTFIGKFTKREIVEGEKDKGIFDGSKFQISEFTNSVDLKGSDKLGKTYKLMLDKEGKIFDWEIYEKEISQHYGVLVDMSTVLDVNVDRFGKTSLGEKPSVRIFTDTGSLKTYYLNTDDLDFSSEDSITLGDINLEYDEEDERLSVNQQETFLMKSLVKFKLNDRNNIVSLELIGKHYAEGDYNEKDKLLKGYNVKEDTIIFDLRSNNEENWKLSSSPTLLENNLGYYEVSSGNFDVVAVTVE